MSDDEKPVKNLKRSDAQCVLNANLLTFVGLYEERLKSELPTSYTVIKGDALKTRTHLSSKAAMAPFLKLNNAQLSSLIPFTRLYKETPKNLTEFHFDSYHDHSTMTTDQWGRGAGSGIKSVSIDMEGNSTATASRQYKVTIKFYFASIEELFRDRRDEDRVYSYSDLFTPSHNFKTKFEPCDNIGSSALQNRTPTTRFLLKFGYSQPQGESLMGSDREVILEACQRAQRSVYLNLYKHSVDFNENGTVSLTAEYHGAVDRQFINIDVLQLGLTRNQRVDESRDLKRKEQAECENNESLKALNSPSKKPQAPCEPPPPKETEKEKEDREDLKEEKQDKAEEYAEELAEMRTKGYNSFMNKLIRSGRVYSYDSSQGKLDYKTYKLKDQVLSLKRNVNQKHSGFRNYFFFGDLLESVFELARDDLTDKKFTFMLGSLSYRDPQTKKVSEIPIAGMPISMVLFKKWFKQHVIKKGERTTYNLEQFLRDVLNNLLKNSFTINCFQPQGKAIDKTAMPTMPSFSVDTFHTKENLNGQNLHYTAIKKEQIDPINVEKPYTNYYYYGVNPTDEKSPKTDGTEEADSGIGIFHLITGREFGLVKTVKFTKEEQKYLTEARMMKSGFDKTGMLRGLYNADVSLFGNALFKPGMMVYIGSTSFAARHAKEIGLGGYYMVAKVYNSIEDGKFKTELKCKFHHHSNSGGGVSC